MEEEKELILAIRKDKKFYREEVKENEPNEAKSNQEEVNEAKPKEEVNEAKSKEEVNEAKSKESKPNEGKKYKYYENDEELFIQDNDEKEEVNKRKKDEARFSNVIRTELSNLLGSGFENIILFLGAGASIVLGEKGPDTNYGKTVAMIAKDVDDKLNNERNVYSLEKLSNMINYMEADIYENSKLKKEFDLENFLTRLIGYIKYSKYNNRKNKLKRTKDRIFEIIKNDTIYNETLSDKFGHAAILKYFSSLLGNEHKLNVITTNYDTVIEDTAENLKFNVIDGFSFSSNPVFDSSMFDWSFAKSIPNLKSNEIIYKPNVINLLKIHGSVNWERSMKKVLRKKPEQFSISDSVMVFPTSDKYEQSYEEPYFELFSKFRELLQIPNTLIFTSGFSFADNHISRIILDALKTNNGLSIVVSDYNINKENNDNIKELYVLMENNYPVSFLKASMNNDLNKYLGVSDVD